MDSDSPPTALETLKKGHPKGLYVLFFSEMWERFSFYGMRALLVLYMTKHLDFSDKFATSVYGAYTALVYATPIFGGLIADRILGFRKAVILGGVLMALGHFAMAFESLLYPALALIIVGNGFFKPNISTIVGRLYKEGDVRRDAGFTIFYMGINLGAFLSPLICGYLGETFGWHYGFGLAGIGMIAGLINFQLGSHRFEGKAEPPDREQLKRQIAPGLNVEWAVYLGALVCVVVATLLVGQFKIVGILMNTTTVIVITALVWFGINKCQKIERDRLYVAMALALFSVVFWSFFEQAGSSLNLFTDRNVDRTFGDGEIAASQFQALNALFIILLAPLFSITWRRLGAAGNEPNTPVKFGLAILQMGLGYGCLFYGAWSSQEDGMVGVIWLVLGYLFHTTGELCLSPVGLSAMTKLSPLKITGLMMGFWFLASAYAQYVAGIVAGLMGIEGENGGKATDVPATETVMVYGHVFGVIALVAAGFGILVLALSPILKKRMHGIN